MFTPVVAHPVTPRRTGRQDPLGGGLVLSPFGTFYAPNSLPTRRRHRRLERGGLRHRHVKGTSPDGSHYYPAFPNLLSAHALEDVRDLFAYIKTLPAVQGRCATTICRSVQHPPHARRLEVLFLDGQPFQPDPPSRRNGTAAPIWSTPGHCAECHSPRNLLGGIVASAALCGRPDPGRRGLGPEHHAEGFGRVVREGHRVSAGDRRHAGRRFGRRQMTAVVRNTAQLPPRTAPRWRPTSSRCRRSRAEAAGKPKRNSRRFPSRGMNRKRWRCCTPYMRGSHA